MSTVRADNFGNRAGTSSISADTMLQGTAKAWLNMNGTGTIAVRDSFNVSSLVDNGVGSYVENFVVVFPNAYYTTVASPRTPGSFSAAIVVYEFQIASRAMINVSTAAPADIDATYLGATHHGDPT